jgi:3-methyladenine DNA glycosylase AlkD
METFDTIVLALKKKANKEKAAFLPRFFKTGKGEYGEGDQFHGVTVPEQRQVAKLYHASSDKKTIIRLLDSSFHEERLTGLLILCHKFSESKKQEKEKQWVDLYLKKADRVNNWDLVDTTAHIILGQWLENRDRSILYSLARDPLLWKNRIAVVATLHFIRKNDLKDILMLSKMMLTHQHDLIHKATGWMLREAWKRNPTAVEDVLMRYRSTMPRTMLRYAIERMPEKQRKKFL